MNLSCEKFKKEAKYNFEKREYKKALFYYSLALNESPIDQEAKIGAILADMALEQEEEAMALFDFYEIEKSKNLDNAEEIIKAIIKSNDDKDEEFNNFLSKLEKNREFGVDELNSISYDDFLEHIKFRGSFKIAFEDVIFSTKVFINKKENLIDFINKLIENGFDEMAMNYIENSLKTYPQDKDFLQLLEKLSRK